MWQEIARGALLTGVAASTAATAFLLVHLEKTDPWALPAAAIGLATWAVSLVFWACDYGVRLGTKRGYMSSPTPSRDRWRYGYHISLVGMLGVILACALLFTLIRPVVQIGSAWARSISYEQLFPTLSRDELHQRLASGDLEVVVAACLALEKRGLNDADCAVIAATIADTRLSIRTRRFAGLCLMGSSIPLTDEILSPIANELDRNDPEVQVMAAELLSQLAADSPEKFEVGFLPKHAGWIKDWEKYRAKVPLFQQWWKTRKMRNK
jgi:hypothetical protein